MFDRKPNPQIEELNQAITQVHKQLADESPESDTYKVLVERLDSLYTQIAKIPSGRISPDIIATVAANLLGLAMVVGHERANVIGGKAITFVKQLGR